MKAEFSIGRCGWSAALALLLTACAPSYYLTVRPSASAGEGAEDHQMLLAELDSVEMGLSFAHQRTTELLFAAEVRNGSSRPILVDPAQFYCQPSITPAGASAPGGAYFPARVPAIDPELKLRTLADQLSTADRKATGVSAWEWLTIASDLTADLSAPKRKETPKEEYERKVQYDRSLQNFDYSRDQHAQTADRTARELELWQHQMLRRYTLQPGELMRGYIVFPSLNQTARLHISTPVGPHTFTFTFDQKPVKH
ncbi:hypothetical protein [Hymenobacter algoricola]|uniref:Lipoprotein n=1 Tax=Hymenobacter algoricola TaxID=486267 RepID=A0ABP7MLT2_9BACT